MLRQWLDFFLKKTDDCFAHFGLKKLGKLQPLSKKLKFSVWLPESKLKIFFKDFDFCSDQIQECRL